jgi:TPP-dependent indolepyruvate ferredoxin oxidoreductase alpha subunit
MGNSHPISPDSKQYLRNENRSTNQKKASKNHSKRMKGRAPHNKTQITIDGIQYDSITQAMKKLNIGFSKLKGML